MSHGWQALCRESISWDTQRSHNSRCFEIKKKSEIPVMMMHFITTVIIKIFKHKVLLVKCNQFYMPYLKMHKQNGDFETVK